MWPKQFSAVITAVIFGEITAETVSALLASFGHTAEIEFSAETAIFGRNSRFRPKKSLFRPKSLNATLLRLTCWFRGLPTSPNLTQNYGTNSHFWPENVHFCRKWLFRPKIHLRPKFRLWPNFGFLKAISYGYGVSEKILFRSHTISKKATSLRIRPGFPLTNEWRLCYLCTVFKWRELWDEENSPCSNDFVRACSCRLVPFVVIPSTLILFCFRDVGPTDLITGHRSHPR